MLDSGSSLSLLRRNSLATMVGVQQLAQRPTVRLVTAAGTHLPIADYVQASVKIGNVEVTQQFLVVDSLIAPVILGIDFMKRHKVTHWILQPHLSVCTSMGLNFLSRNSHKNSEKCGTPGVMRRVRCVQLLFSMMAQLTQWMNAVSPSLMQKPDMTSLSVKMNLSLRLSRSTKTYSARHQEHRTKHNITSTPQALQCEYHHGVFQSTTETKWRLRFNKCWSKV